MATTNDRIFEIADELDAAGHNPTLAAVRKTLGGGSFTTISQAMTEWRARKAAKETPIREAAPQAIADLLQNLGSEVWAAALTLANGRLASERQALEEARSEMEAQRAEAAELADQVSNELEDAKHQVTQAKDALAKAEQQLAQKDLVIAEHLKNEAVRLARLEETERRANQLNAELERVSAQNAELIRTLSEISKTATGTMPGQKSPKS